MEISTLIIGIVIGLVIGFGVAWLWASAAMKAKNKAGTATEAELKALLAEQANDHLRYSSESIDRISEELDTLKAGMLNYEKSLASPIEDESKSSYFGEHASLFLRNTAAKVSKSDKEKNTGDQPRDFSSKSSGLFVGHPDVESLPLKKKSNK